MIWTQLMVVTGAPTSWLAVAVVAVGLLGLILGAAVRARRRA